MCSAWNLLSLYCKPHLLDLHLTLDSWPWTLDAWHLTFDTSRSWDHEEVWRAGCGWPCWIKQTFGCLTQVSVRFPSQLQGKYFLSNLTLTATLFYGLEQCLEHIPNICIKRKTLLGVNIEGLYQGPTCFSWSFSL